MLKVLAATIASIAIVNAAQAAVPLQKSGDSTSGAKKGAAGAPSQGKTPPSGAKKGSAGAGDKK